MSAFLLINDPNLNLLGSREPAVCHATRPVDVEAVCIVAANSMGREQQRFQGNAKHELNDRGQRRAIDAIDFIILNPGRLTNSRVALRNGLLAVQIPFIEIQLCQPFLREESRQIRFLVISQTGNCLVLGRTAVSMQ